jgi:signal transduction histidine kinase/CheY-like chemotaxis protein
MREKAPIILIVSIGIFLLSLFGLFRQREAASLKETLPHDLVAAEASLMDRFSATQRSLSWLFEQYSTQQGEPSALSDALRNYLAQHADLICLAVLDMKGGPQLVLPEHEKALVASLLQQKDLKFWITEAEARGKEVFTPGLGLAGGRQSFGQALPILEEGRITRLVLVVYDFDLLLQHNLPKWVQQKYEAALVSASHRPLAILNRQPSSELTTSLRSRHDLTGHQIYLRLSAFPQSLGWQALTLLALGVAILISASIVLIGLSRDLHKRRMQAEDYRQQNKIIEAANAAKDQFIASMSHEIRTPLSAIMGYTEIMASRQQQSMIPEIQGIRRNSQHLSQLLGDLLDYSRLQADILVPQRETYALETLLRELAAATVPQAQAKGLMIEVRSQGPIPDRMDSDPGRLRQILINLLGNAIKFTDHGTIRLEIAETQKSEQRVLRLAVNDTGIGIPEDEKHRLFQSFTQLSFHQKRGAAGSGLGLAISRRLAELLEGRLYLQSSTVGKGSCFVLELDRYEAQDMKRQPLAPASLDSFLKQTGQMQELALIPRTILRGRVILVTDDDDDNRQILSHLLTMAGAEVYEARDGQEALTRIEGTALSCILLDLSMPGMNGYETLARIKELGIRIPIFALTASALSTERSKALAAGFQGFYTKPLSFQTFPEHLADQLQQLTGDAVPSPDKAEPQPAEHLSEGFRELRARFFERLAARLERLKEAWTRQDSLELRRESHSLVGTADQYGFHELATAARLLEGYCQDETLDPAAADAYRRLEDHIAIILRNQG